jgi:Putative Mg2+ and Co2+ transporter CorB
LEDIPISLLLAALAVLLVASGFFSAAETSMMALNRYRLKHLVREGHRGAKLTATLLDKTDKLLGVVLLGNNLLNAASAALVTLITIRLFGSNELMLTAGTLAVTFLILVFSEVTPKVLGATYPERIAFPAGYLLAPMLKLFYPAVWFVNLFVRGLLALARIKPPENLQANLSMEELRSVVLEAGGFIPEKHQSVLLNIFDLEKSTVDDVMTPRSQIEAIDLTDPLEQILHQISTCYHTRLPVCEGTLDNIVGVLHVRKVLHVTQSEDFTLEELRKIIREPYFIPSGTPLFSQIQFFQENQRRVGLVVDEYGELLGLVSMEDILEEIVGEFTTHSPAFASSYVQQPDGSWVVDGGALLRDLNRKLGLDFPLSGPKTLNGLILEHLEDIPESGTSLKIGDQALEILQTQDRAVKTVLVFPHTGSR